MWATRLVFKSVKANGHEDDFNIQFYIDKLNIAVKIMNEEIALQNDRKKTELTNKLKEQNA
jgi:hypothetical protein